MDAKQSIVKASDDGDCASLHSLSFDDEDVEEYVPDLDDLMEKLKKGDSSYYKNAIKRLPDG